MRKRVLICVALLCALATSAPVVSAMASSSTGYDISYPQCNGTFPANPGFAIVGVNDGLPYSANPCLGTGSGPSELQWAGTGAGLYANTANPGAALSSHWPSGQTTPQQCNTSSNPGLATAQCSYDYGWNAAANSYQDAVSAYIAVGLAPVGATRTPAANQWWLDVESANSWTTNTALNVAELQGEADYLKSVGAATVGFYANTSDWQSITGNTSTFASYPSWVPGASSLSQAQAGCTGSGFTGGGVALTQYPSGGFDGDYLCATAPPPPNGTLSFSSAPQQLTAGTVSQAMSVALSPTPASATTVTVSSSSSGGTFATSPTGSGSSTLSVPVAAGATSASFYYTDTHAGTPVLTANVSGYSGATQTESVTAGPLTSITVTPAGARVRVGSQTSFSATGHDAFGNAVAITPSWSVSPALGSFSATSGNPVTFTAAAAGSGTITATVATSSGAVSGKTSITVTTKRSQGSAPNQGAGGRAAPALISPSTSRPPTMLPARRGG